jgi:hypothetical protein
MTVSPQDRDAMARLLQIMNGESVQVTESATHADQMPVELAGAGRPSRRDVQAMADVLRKLESAVQTTSAEMMVESYHDHNLKEALITNATADGVQIGIYKIQQGLDESRTAGKQYYNVINSVSEHTIASELSLYEAAHGLVRLLNSGHYVNSPQVIKLLDAESSYTSHKIDAVRYHRMSKKAEREGQHTRAQLMETRKMDSLDKAMAAKRSVKKLYNQT